MVDSINTHHIIPVAVWDQLRTGGTEDIIGNILGSDVDTLSLSTEQPYDQYDTSGPRGKFDLDSSANLINLPATVDIQEKMLATQDMNGDNIFLKHGMGGAAHTNSHADYSEKIKELIIDINANKEDGNISATEAKQQFYALMDTARKTIENAGPQDTVDSLANKIGDDFLAIKDSDIQRQAAATSFENSINPTDRGEKSYFERKNKALENKYLDINDPIYDENGNQKTRDQSLHQDLKYSKMEMFVNIANDMMDQNAILKGRGEPEIFLRGEENNRRPIDLDYVTNSATNPTGIMLGLVQVSQRAEVNLNQLNFFKQQYNLQNNTNFTSLNDIVNHQESISNWFVDRTNAIITSQSGDANSTAMLAYSGATIAAVGTYAASLPGGPLADVVDGVSVLMEDYIEGLNTGDYSKFFDSATEYTEEAMVGAAIFIPLMASPLGAVLAPVLLVGGIAAFASSAWNIIDTVMDGLNNSETMDESLAKILIETILPGTEYSLSAQELSLLGFDMEEGGLVIQKGTSLDDTYVDDAGYNIYDGGEGFDTLDLSGSGTRIIIDNNLIIRKLIEFASSLLDKEFAFNFEEYILSAHNDEINFTSREVDMTFHLGEGDDRAALGSGNDTVYTEAGNNVIFSGEGSDTIYLNHGSHYIDGGQSTYITSVDSETGEPVYANHIDTVYMTDEEFDTVDTTVTLSANHIHVGSGSLFFGEGSNLDNVEQLFLGGGNDTIKYTNVEQLLGIAFVDAGTGGLDTLDMSASSIDWSITANGTISVSDSITTQTYNNFETLITGSGNDSLTIDENTDLTTIMTGQGSDIITVNGTLPQGILIDGDAGENSFNTSDKDTLKFNDTLSRTFDLDTAGPKTITTVNGELLLFQNIELIESNTLAFSIEENTDQDIIVDFSNFDGRIHFRDTGVVRTISSNTYNDWIYSGDMAIILGADHIIGTNNGDNFIGADGQTMNLGAGNDYVNIFSADEVTLGEGSDMLRWHRGFAEQRTGTDAQIITDFTSEDYLRINGMNAVDVVYSEENGDTTLTHAPTGLELLLKNVDMETVQQKTIFEDGSAWLGTTGNDDKSYSSSNSARVMYGFDGRDRLTGGNGTDRLFGGNDRDYLYGGNNRDYLYGGAGDDYIVGGRGSDRLYGGDGNDRLRPWDAPDSTGNLVYGGNGSDFYHGSRTMINNPQWDTFYGGEGRDIFYIPDAGYNRWFGGRNQPHQRMADFDHTEDLIVLARDRDDNWVRYGQSVVQVGNHVQIGINDNRMILNTTVAEVRDALIWVNHTNDYNEAIAIWNDIKTDGTRDWLGNDSDNTLTGRDGADALYGGGGNDTLNGRDGDDVIYAGSGNDRVYAGAGDDEIHALGGTNTVFGEDGNDWIDGRTNDGTDRLYAYGGNGDDIIYGTTGSDYIRGDDGNDTIEASVGQDTVYGGAGDDTINGQGSDDTIYGDEGNDMLVGGSGDDVVYGGEGADIIDGFRDNDTLYGGTSGDVLYGGDGDDFLDGGQWHDILNGGEGSDVFRINVYSGDDVIEDFTSGTDQIEFGYGVFEPTMSLQDILNTATVINGDTIFDYGSGTVRLVGVTSLTIDDIRIASDFITDGTTITGTNGDDDFAGFDSDDVLLGMDGDDRIWGEEGNDTLDGGWGNNMLYGGSGDDTLFVGQGTSIDTTMAYGGDGKDTLALTDPFGMAFYIQVFMSDDPTNMGTVNNTSFGEVARFSEIENIIGTDTRDQIQGNAGNNRFEGMNGDDFLAGMNGDDTLFGGAQNDFLYGGDGDDALYGGTGRDRLRGDAGFDTFYFNADAGTDTIEDFTAGEDLLDFTLGIQMTETDFLATNVTYTQTDTLIDFGNGNSVTLTGVTTLTVDDFSLS